MSLQRINGPICKKNVSRIVGVEYSTPVTQLLQLLFDWDFCLIGIKMMASLFLLHLMLHSGQL